MIDLRVVADPAAEVADLLLDVACAGGHIALSGGSTPQHAYELVSRSNEDMSAATLWLGDERIVPVDTALGQDGAAAAYESLLRENLGNHPRLDLALMGLGPDGHTASLFPGQPALQESHRLAVGVPDAGMEPMVARMTLTLPLFNTAREVVFLVAGADKAEAVRRAFGTPPNESVPAAHVRPGAGKLLVVLDEPAAAELPSEAVTS